MENIDFIGLIGEKEDKLPIEYEVMAGSELELPNRFVLNDDYFQNQGLEKITAYMCTAFSTTSGINEVKHKRLNPDRYEGKTLGQYMINKGRLDPKVGAYLVDAVKSAKELNYISGWTLVNTIESIKKAIFNDKPIVVGSSIINWKETQKSPFIAIKGNTYGHAFLIVGYDDNLKLLICENSYGDKVFDKGRFYIKYEDLALLFNSKFAIHIDDSNFNKLNKLLKESKKYNNKDFYDMYIKHKTGTERRMGELAAQMRYIGKVNNKELLKLL